MRITTKIRNNNDVFVSIDDIMMEPTNDVSRASLLCLNNKLRWEEINSLADSLHIDLNALLKEYDAKGPNAAKSILLTIIKNNFLDERSRHGKLTCEYCARKVSRNTNPTNDNRATVDHKTPKSEDIYDALDVRNFAVSCYRCNNRKGSMSYDEWCVVSKKILDKNIYELKRAKSIGEILLKKTCEIHAIMNSSKNVRTLYQIANITKIAREFLLEHLTNLDVVPHDVRKSMADIKELTRINIIARHKANPALDDKLSVDKEFKEFFQTNKKWSKVNHRGITNKK